MIKMLLTNTSFFDYDDSVWLIGIISRIFKLSSVNPCLRRIFHEPQSKITGQILSILPIGIAASILEAIR